MGRFQKERSKVAIKRAVPARNRAAILKELHQTQEFLMSGEIAALQPSAAPAINALKMPMIPAIRENRCEVGFRKKSQIRLSVKSVQPI